MKIIKKLLLVSGFLAAGAASQLAVAVDGYQDLKFGMSKKQVFAKQICSLQEYESGYAGVDYFGCMDFTFGGKPVEAGVFFIDDSFLRFVIVPPVDDAFGLMEALSNKFGSPSSSSTQSEFEAVDTHPNREAFLAYDQDTVFLRLMSDENYMQSIFLVYTSPLYEELLVRNQKSSIMSDL